MLSVPSEKVDSPKGLLSNLLGLKAGEKPDLSNDKFSLLLKSFSLLDKEELPQSLDDFIDLKEEVDPKAEKSILTKLFALGDEVKDLKKDESFLHVDILKDLPIKDFKKNIKLLIGEAKEYLKDQISQKIDIKELPKTLGGLIKLAEKSGIDVKGINFESLPQTPGKEKLEPLLKLAKKTITHSTKELVEAEPIKQEIKTKTKPLEALLSGKSVEKENPELSLTGKESVIKDIKKSVINIKEQESRVSETKAQKVSSISPALSALLHGKEESTETEVTPKIESEKLLDKPNDKAQTVLANKTEQLSSKINEAKQLVQHMAQNIKDSIENYKPPFTRIKMQLNPQKFGEMDVTMVQRGNNVHININANTSALTVMMQNAHELKAALSAQGLGDAQMNFSSHQQQQNEKHRQEQGHLTYEEFQELQDEFENEITEVATALEVVVPRYI